MNTFGNVQKEVVAKYMDAFIELAKLVPEIEKADIEALQNMSKHIKDDCDMAPEVAAGYAAVCNRVHDMIFTGNVKRIPYTNPNRGVYKHRVNYKTLGKSTSRLKPITFARDTKLHSLEFDTYESAADFYNTLVDYISEYGEVAVGAVIDEYDKIYDTNNYTPTFYDYKCGWTSLPSKHSDVIVRDGYAWAVRLPYPAALN